MKLSSDTPPNGDFARYVDILESQSPAYQMLRQSGRNEEVLRSLPGMVPPPQRHVLKEEGARPVSADAHFGRAAPVSVSTASTGPAAPVPRAAVATPGLVGALRAWPLLQLPLVRDWAAPWLLRLEQLERSVTAATPKKH